MISPYLYLYIYIYIHQNTDDTDFLVVHLFIWQRSLVYVGSKAILSTNCYWGNPWLNRCPKHIDTSLFVCQIFCDRDGKHEFSLAWKKMPTVPKMISGVYPSCQEVTLRGMPSAAGGSVWTSLPVLSMVPWQGAPAAVSIDVLPTNGAWIQKKIRFNNWYW